jgi:predicted nucleotidyltransferase
MAIFNYSKFIESMNPTYEDKLVKKYLYVIRSYLVGECTLVTGEVKPCILDHLEHLDKEDAQSILDLIEKKKKAEYQVSAIDHKRYRNLVAKLAGRLEIAKINSPLKDKPDNEYEWDDYLYNVRLRFI